jgi:hypothetical protein
MGQATSARPERSVEDAPLCAECARNSADNEAAGQPEMAEAVRKYCRSGHDPELALQVEDSS